MSLFLGDINAAKYQEIDEQKIKIASLQFAAQAQTFDKTKCIPNEYGEGELNKGESVCVDRCVSKFVQVNLKIGQRVSAHKFSNPKNLPAYENLQ